MGRHVDETKPVDGLSLTRGICPLYCDRPWDQEEGRFCPMCQDYEATCANDHCSECGADT